MKTAGCPVRQIKARPWFAVQQLVRCAWRWEIVFIIFGSFFTCSASADGLSQYKDFISNPPWIKKMIWAESGNLHAVRIGDAEPHDTPGFVVFNAVIQSNSWYLEIVTNAPSGPKGVDESYLGNGFAVGKSFTNFWSVGANRKEFTLCSIKASDDTPVKIIAGIWLDNIHVVQKLGLVYLEPRNFPDVPQFISWVDELNFKAETATHGIMKGKVVGFTNGFPEKVEFGFSKIPKTIFSVVYGYETERPFPPSSITAYKTTGKNTEQLWKFLLYNIETGDLGSDFNGFSPENFMSSDQMVLAKKFIQDGGRLTLVSSNGIAKDVPRAVPNYSFMEVKRTLSKSGIKSVRILIGSLMIASFVILFWLVKKTDKKVR